MNIDTATAFPCDRAADGIDDAKYSPALALDFLHRRERVEGFTRLAHRDIERVLLDNRVAVAKLRGRFGVSGDARELLDQLSARDIPQCRPSRSLRS